ncbi:Segregation and condensation protein B [Acidisarcina polymorpha]|uniref:Segregation and condensation protein B n=1 Tax=Acidisarcina polymorpha TaxID=2211140 RepID=A0A2Z5G3F5_9BACT|nr:SMC-Scp complex subunit ScpB [Acidisarcina polymorpha]AXC13733.1 Segregation and condensation protein B [Acidisarcina polymorpha]
MSLQAKIEAVIYAAEEPVTLAQLAGIFARELPAASEEPPAEWITAESASPESLVERGLLEVTNLTAPESDMAEVALLEGLEERSQASIHDPTAAEAEAKRAARQRERELREQVKAIVDRLIEEYSNSDRGMEIREVAGGYRIATKPEYHDAVRSFVKSLKPPMKLSLQALETLAVIAYKQPVTGPEVSEIRGVDSGGVLGSLVSRKLITTAGRKQVIGRPILYKTTREFLLRFGLRDLNELPSIEEFERLAGDMDISDDESGEDGTTLPFEASESNAIEANAGEAGLAIEPPSPAPEQSEERDASPTPADPSSPAELLPHTVALETEVPGSTPNAAIEVTPAAHPTVPIEENDGHEK